MGKIIDIKGLTKSYHNIIVLSSVNLEIQRGGIYGLIGNNGAGKTTFMKLLLGFERSQEGEITYYDQDGNPSKKVKIGTLIEHPGLYGDMTAYQNIKVQSLALGMRLSRSDIMDLLDKVGLVNVGRKLVKAFSMGMKQRLGIAIALVGNPELLILDEPLNGLDPVGILEIRDILIKLNKEKGVTMIISSHILDELAKIATHFCILDKGKVIRDCSKESFMEECGDTPIDEYYVNLLS